MRTKSLKDIWNPGQLYFTMGFHLLEMKNFTSMSWMRRRHCQEQLIIKQLLYGRKNLQVKLIRFLQPRQVSRDETLRKALRSKLSRERTTRLEGSFGTRKQHYSLSRIKARGRKTEILWILFGIHTGNAVLMITKSRTDWIKRQDIILRIKSEEVFKFLPERNLLPDKI